MATESRAGAVEAEDVQTKLLAVLDAVKQLPLSAQQETLSVLEQKVKEFHVSPDSGTAELVPGTSQPTGGGRSSRSRRRHVQDAEESKSGWVRKTRSRVQDKQKKAKEDKSRTGSVETQESIPLDMEVENVADPSNVEPLFDDSDDEFEASVNLGNVTAALSLSSDSENDVIELESETENNIKGSSTPKKSLPFTSVTSPGQSSFALAFQMFAIGNSVNLPATTSVNAAPSTYVNTIATLPEQQNDIFGSSNEDGGGCSLKIVNTVSLAPVKKRGRPAKKGSKANKSSKIDISKDAISVDMVKDNSSNVENASIFESSSQSKKSVPSSDKEYSRKRPDRRSTRNIKEEKSLHSEDKIIGKPEEPVKRKQSAREKDKPSEVCKEKSIKVKGKKKSGNESAVRGTGRKDKSDDDEEERCTFEGFADSDSDIGGISPGVIGDSSDDEPLGIGSIKTKTDSRDAFDLLFLTDTGKNTVKSGASAVFDSHGKSVEDKSKEVNIILGEKNDDKLLTASNAKCLPIVSTMGNLQGRGKQPVVVLEHISIDQYFVKGGPQIADVQVKNISKLNDVEVTERGSLDHHEEAVSAISNEGTGTNPVSAPQEEKILPKSPRGRKKSVAQAALTDGVVADTSKDTCDASMNEESVEQGIEPMVEECEAAEIDRNKKKGRGRKKTTSSEPNSLLTAEESPNEKDTKGGTDREELVKKRSVSRGSKKEEPDKSSENQITQDSSLAANVEDTEGGTVQEELVKKRSVSRSRKKKEEPDKFSKENEITQDSSPSCNAEDAEGSRDSEEMVKKRSVSRGRKKKEEADKLSEEDQTKLDKSPPANEKDTEGGTDCVELVKKRSVSRGRKKEEPDKLSEEDQITQNNSTAVNENDTEPSTDHGQLVKKRSVSRGRKKKEQPEDKSSEESQITPDSSLAAEKPTNEKDTEGRKDHEEMVKKRSVSRGRKKKEETVKSSEDDQSTQDSLMSIEGATNEKDNERDTDQRNEDVNSSQKSEISHVHQDVIKKTPVSRGRKKKEEAVKSGEENQVTPDSSQTAEEASSKKDTKAGTGGISLKKKDTADQRSDHVQSCEENEIMQETPQENNKKRPASRGRKKTTSSELDNSVAINKPLKDKDDKDSSDQSYDDGKSIGESDITHAPVDKKKSVSRGRRRSIAPAGAQEVSTTKTNAGNETEKVGNIESSIDPSSDISHTTELAQDMNKKMPTKGRKKSVGPKTKEIVAETDMTHLPVGDTIDQVKTKENAESGPERSSDEANSGNINHTVEDENETNKNKKASRGKRKSTASEMNDAVEEGSLAMIQGMVEEGSSEAKTVDSGKAVDGQATSQEDEQKYVTAVSHQVQQLLGSPKRKPVVLLLNLSPQDIEKHRRSIYHSGPNLENNKEVGGGYNSEESGKDLETPADQDKHDVINANSEDVDSWQVDTMNTGVKDSIEPPQDMNVSGAQAMAKSESTPDTHKTMSKPKSKGRRGRPRKVLITGDLNCENNQGYADEIKIAGHPETSDFMQPDADTVMDPETCVNSSVNDEEVETDAFEELSQETSTPVKETSSRDELDSCSNKSTCNDNAAPVTSTSSVSDINIPVKENESLKLGRKKGRRRKGFKGRKSANSNLTDGDNIFLSEREGKPCESVPDSVDAVPANIEASLGNVLESQKDIVSSELVQKDKHQGNVKDVEEKAMESLADSLSADISTEVTDHSSSGQQEPFVEHVDSEEQKDRTHEPPDLNDPEAERIIPKKGKHRGRWGQSRHQEKVASEGLQRNDLSTAVNSEENNVIHKGEYDAVPLSEQNSDEQKGSTELESDIVDLGNTELKNSVEEKHDAKDTDSGRISVKKGKKRGRPPKRQSKMRASIDHATCREITPDSDHQEKIANQSKQSSGGDQRENAQNNDSSSAVISEKNKTSDEGETDHQPNQDLVDESDAPDPKRSKIDTPTGPDLVNHRVLDLISPDSSAGNLKVGNEDILSGQPEINRQKSSGRKSVGRKRKQGRASKGKFNDADQAKPSVNPFPQLPEVDANRDDQSIHSEASCSFQVTAIVHSPPKVIGTVSKISTIPNTSVDTHDESMNTLDSSKEQTWKDELHSSTDVCFTPQSTGVPLKEVVISIENMSVSQIEKLVLDISKNSEDVEEQQCVEDVHVSPGSSSSKLDDSTADKDETNEESARKCVVGRLGEKRNDGSDADGPLLAEQPGDTIMTCVQEVQLEDANTLQTEITNDQLSTKRTGRSPNKKPGPKTKRRGRKFSKSPSNADNSSFTAPSPNQAGSELVYQGDCRDGPCMDHEDLLKNVSSSEVPSCEQNDVDQDFCAENDKQGEIGNNSDAASPKTPRRRGRPPGKVLCEESIKSQKSPRRGRKSVPPSDNNAIVSLESTGPASGDSEFVIAATSVAPEEINMEGKSSEVNDSGNLLEEVSLEASGPEKGKTGDVAPRRGRPKKKLVKSTSHPNKTCEGNQELGTGLQLEKNCEESIKHLDEPPEVPEESSADVEELDMAINENTRTNSSEPPKESSKSSKSFVQNQTKECRNGEESLQNISPKRGRSKNRYTSNSPRRSKNQGKIHCNENDYNECGESVEDKAVEETDDKNSSQVTGIHESQLIPDQIQPVECLEVRSHLVTSEDYQESLNVPLTTCGKRGRSRGRGRGRRRPSPRTKGTVDVIPAESNISSCMNEAEIAGQGGVEKHNESQEDVETELELDKAESGAAEGVQSLITSGQNEDLHIGVPRRKNRTRKTPKKGKASESPDCSQAQEKSTTASSERGEAALTMENQQTERTIPGSSKCDQSTEKDDVAEMSDSTIIMDQEGERTTDDESPLTHLLSPRYSKRQTGAGLKQSTQPVKTSKRASVRAQRSSMVAADPEEYPVLHDQSGGAVEELCSDKGMTCVNSPEESREDILQERKSTELDKKTSAVRKRGRPKRAVPKDDDLNSNSNFVSAQSGLSTDTVDECLTPTETKYNSETDLSESGTKCDGSSLPPAEISDTVCHDGSASRLSSPENSPRKLSPRGRGKRGGRSLSRGRGRGRGRSLSRKRVVGEGVLMMSDIAVPQGTIDDTPTEQSASMLAESDRDLTASLSSEKESEDTDETIPTTPVSAVRRRGRPKKEDTSIGSIASDISPHKGRKSPRSQNEDTDVIVDTSQNQQDSAQVPRETTIVKTKEIRAGSENVMEACDLSIQEGPKIGHDVSSASFPAPLKELGIISVEQENPGKTPSKGRKSRSVTGSEPTEIAEQTTPTGSGCVPENTSTKVRGDVATITDTSTEQHLKVAEDETVYIETPRRRGRPRKEISSDNSILTTSKSSRKGRKTKSVPPYTAEEIVADNTIINEVMPIRGTSNQSILIPSTDSVYNLSSEKEMSSENAEIDISDKQMQHQTVEDGEKPSSFSAVPEGKDSTENEGKDQELPPKLPAGRKRKSARSSPRAKEFPTDSSDNQPVEIVATEEKGVDDLTERSTEEIETFESSTCKEGQVSEASISDGFSVNEPADKPKKRGRPKKDVSGKCGTVPSANTPGSSRRGRKPGNAHWKNVEETPQAEHADSKDGRDVAKKIKKSKGDIGPADETLISWGSNVSLSELEESQVDSSEQHSSRTSLRSHEQAVLASGDLSDEQGSKSPIRQDCAEQVPARPREQSFQADHASNEPQSSDAGLTSYEEQGPGSTPNDTSSAHEMSLSGLANLPSKSPVGGVSIEEPARGTAKRKGRSPKRISLRENVKVANSRLESGVRSIDAGRNTLAIPSNVSSASANSQSIMTVDKTSSMNIELTTVSSGNDASPLNLVLNESREECPSSSRQNPCEVMKNALNKTDESAVKVHEENTLPKYRRKRGRPSRKCGVIFDDSPSCPEDNDSTASLRGRSNSSAGLESITDENMKKSDSHVESPSGINSSAGRTEEISDADVTGEADIIKHVEVNPKESVQAFHRNHADISTSRSGSSKRKARFESSSPKRRKTLPEPNESQYCPSDAEYTSVTGKKWEVKNMQDVTNDVGRSATPSTGSAPLGVEYSAGLHKGAIDVHFTECSTPTPRRRGRPPKFRKPLAEDLGNDLPNQLSKSEKSVNSHMEQSSLLDMRTRPQSVGAAHQDSDGMVITQAEVSHCSNSLSQHFNVSVAVDDGVKKGGTKRRGKTPKRSGKFRKIEPLESPGLNSTNDQGFHDPDEGLAGSSHPVPEGPSADYVCPGIGVRRKLWQCETNLEDAHPDWGVASVTDMLGPPQSCSTPCHAPSEVLSSCQDVKGSSGCRNKPGWVNSVQCQSCGQRFQSGEKGTAWRQLTGHLVANHLKQHWQCDKCGLTFSSSATLGLHQLWHLNWKPFGCPECAYRAFNWADIKSHQLRVHCIVQTWNCGMCNKRFRTKGGRRKHQLKAHLKPSPSSTQTFACNQCAFKATYRVALNIHKHQVHSPYAKKMVCEVCGIETADSVALHIHQKTHEGYEDNYTLQYSMSDGFDPTQSPGAGKPHRCPLCGKTFRMKRSLSVHLAVHDEMIALYGNSGSRGNNFLCELCNKKFSRQSTLLHHQLEHHAEGTYKCSLCPYETIKAYWLNKHVETRHGRGGRIGLPEDESHTAASRFGSLGHEHLQTPADNTYPDTSMERSLVCSSESDKTGSPSSSYNKLKDSSSNIVTMMSASGRAVINRNEERLAEKPEPSQQSLSVGGLREPKFNSGHKSLTNRIVSNVSHSAFYVRKTPPSASRSWEQNMPMAATRNYGDFSDISSDETNGDLTETRPDNSDRNSCNRVSGRQLGVVIGTEREIAENEPCQYGHERDEFLTRGRVRYHNEDFESSKSVVLEVVRDEEQPQVTFEVTLGPTHGSQTSGMPGNSARCRDNTAFQSATWSTQVGHGRWTFPNSSVTDQNLDYECENDESL